MNDVLSKMEIGICMYRGAVIEAQKATTVVMWIDGGIGISDITCLHKYSCVVPDSSTTFLYRLPIPNGHVAMMELWNMMILGC